MGFWHFLLSRIKFLTNDRNRISIQFLLFCCRKDYYQEGSHVYKELNVVEAFRKALTTWGRWVDANINPTRTLVFFRGYSATHFR